MKTSVFYLLLLCSSAFFNFSLSQYNIEGKITDKNNSKLSEIKIKLIETNLTSISDINGKFIFKNIPLGKYTIKIENQNFENYEKKINLINNIDDLEIILVKINSSLLSTKEFDDVFVKASRNILKSSNSIENIDKIDLKQKNFAQDIPLILENSVSAVSSSDAGAGVGYTGLKIRGVDPSRTNVTINGIPINDPESHAVYWVNMPDIVSSLDNIQIQRGVGTSSNGAAAFGASISLQTNKFSKEAYSIIDNSFGSFNTMKNSIFVSTGLLKNNFQTDLRLSRIKSDGFIDRASSDLKSYYLQLSKLENKWTMKVLIFGGKEITYQAWNGVPEAKLNGDNNKLVEHFYNNYYIGGLYQNKEDSINLFSSNNRTFNNYRYKNEVDNYQQHHFQFLNSFKLNDKLNTNIAFHYTRGLGYYEQFKYQDDFYKYNLEEIDTGLGTISQGDFIRRRFLDNHFYGIVYSLEYNNNKNWNVIFGSSANQYYGLHYGEIIWAQYASNSELGSKYYENNALKNDYNFYLKSLYYNDKFSIYSDIQLRTINYSYLGIDENNGIIEEKKQNVNFLFVNPKIGLSYKLMKNFNLFTSYSMAQREPIRDDFRENLNKNQPKAEILHDSELGISFEKKKFNFKLNYYFMYYYNQLILTGKINDVGSYTRINAPYSYRNGIELESKVLLFNDKFNINFNITLSQNKITRFVEFVDDYDNGGQVEIEHKNTDLSFSPSIISALQLKYNFLKYFNIIWSHKFVGKQYLDNTSSIDRSLNQYYFSNLYLNFIKESFLTKEFSFGVQVNNIFNQKYENNGYTWGYLYGGKRIIENFYFPQAGTNFMLRLTLTL